MCLTHASSRTCGRRDYPALSVADAEALVIARAEKAVLLTGDGPLRKAALDAGVDVRRVIGELKRLVAAVIIDSPGALTALESIVTSGLHNLSTSSTASPWTISLPSWFKQCVLSVMMRLSARQAVTSTSAVSMSSARTG